MTAQKLSHTKKITFTATCLALCVLLPFAFHAVPNASAVFCPIHIPVLFCALACGIGYGVLCGAVGPLLCFLFTGSPTALSLLSMTGECIVYALAAGLLMKALKTGNFYADCYISLAVAMIAGRIVAGILQAVLLTGNHFSFAFWLTTYFLTAWPAIVIQLIFIPNVLFGFVKIGLLPERYSERKKAPDDYREDYKELLS